MGCDMLITDYSSVLFDFALTKRPVILFVYDAEEYARDRGMYFPFKIFHFVKAETLKQLQKYITKQKSVKSAKLHGMHMQMYLYPKAAFDPAVCLKKVPVDSITDYADNKNKERTVYFIPKIKRQDIQYLKEAAENHSAIAVLDRQVSLRLHRNCCIRNFMNALIISSWMFVCSYRLKRNLRDCCTDFPGWRPIAANSTNFTKY